MSRTLHCASRAPRWLPSRWPRGSAGPRRRPPPPRLQLDGQAGPGACHRGELPGQPPDRLPRLDAGDGKDSFHFVTDSSFDFVSLTVEFSTGTVTTTTFGPPDAKHAYPFASAVHSDDFPPLSLFAIDDKLISRHHQGAASGSRGGEASIRDRERSPFAYGDGQDGRGEPVVRPTPEASTRECSTMNVKNTALRLAGAAMITLAVAPWLGGGTAAPRSATTRTAPSTADAAATRHRRPSRASTRTRLL